MNLVVALRALLAERNVTRAGRADRSQPARDERRARPAAPPFRRRAAGQEGRRVRADRARERCCSTGPRSPARCSSGSSAASRASTRSGRTASSSSSPPTTPSTVFGAALAREISAQAPQVRIAFRQSVDGARRRSRRRTCQPSTACSCRTASSPACQRSSCSATAGCARWPRTTPRSASRITLSQLATLPWAVYQRAYAAPVTGSCRMLGIEPRVQVWSTASSCCRPWSRAPAGSP